MNLQEYEAASQRINKQARQTTELDPDSDEVLVAQLACYAIQEPHARGASPTSPIRAMTTLKHSDEKQLTGQAIKQVEREIHEKIRPTGKPTKLKVNLETLPKELRLQILRYAIPEEYDIETHDIDGAQTSFGETQYPALPILLLNHKIYNEATTLPSAGVVHCAEIPTLFNALAASSESKKRSIGRVETLFTQPIDVVDRSFKDNMPAGWSDGRKRFVEENVRFTAAEMCRRLNSMYEHQSVEEAQVMWFDKAVTMPCYW